MPSWLSSAAVVDEWIYGPLLDESVVNSQGKYLRPRPSTPVHHPEHDERFITQLDQKLSSLVFVQDLRTRRYGTSVAEEYPISHTPTEIKSAWVEEQQAFDKVLEDLPPTPSDDGSIPTYTSSIGGKTFISNEVTWPKPEMSVPSSVSTKVDSPVYYSHNSTITKPSYFRPASDSKLATLESFSSRDHIMQTLKDLQEQTLATPTRKRRNIDADNMCLTEPTTQKRRLDMPSLFRFIFLSNF